MLRSSEQHKHCASGLIGQEDIDMSLFQGYKKKYVFPHFLYLKSFRLNMETDPRI